MDEKNEWSPSIFPMCFAIWAIVSLFVSVRGVASTHNLNPGPEASWLTMHTGLKLIAGFYHQPPSPLVYPRAHWLVDSYLLSMWMYTKPPNQSMNRMVHTEWIEWFYFKNRKLQLCQLKKQVNGNYKSMSFPPTMRFFFRQMSRCFFSNPLNQLLCFILLV